MKVAGFCLLTLITFSEVSISLPCMDINIKSLSLCLNYLRIFCPLKPRWPFSSIKTTFTQCMLLPEEFQKFEKVCWYCGWWFVCKKQTSSENLSLVWNFSKYQAKLCIFLREGQFQYRERYFNFSKFDLSSKPGNNIFSKFQEICFFKLLFKII